MKNETLIKRLNEIKGKPYDIDLVDTLIKDVLLEMEMETCPKYRGDYMKAASKFAKHCQKECGDVRPHIAGAFMYPYNDTEMRQGICDGYVGVSYSKPIQGLVEIKEGIKPLDFKRILPSGTFYEAKMPDYPTLKKALKLEKANKDSEKVQWNGKAFYSVRLSNGQVVDAERLLLAQELAGMTDDQTEILSHGNQLHSPLYMRNIIDDVEIEVMLMPIRHEGWRSTDRIVDIIDLYDPETVRIMY